MQNFFLFFFFFVAVHLARGDDDNTLSIRLNTGQSLPLVGMGVGNLAHDLITDIVQVGVGRDSMRYRLMDTAQASRNGALIRAGLLDQMTVGNEKEDIHVISKVWYTYLGYERTRIAVQEIVNEIVTPDENHSNIRIHILLHWPRCNDNIVWMECEEEEAALPHHVKQAGPPPHLEKETAFLESWRALQDIYSGTNPIAGYDRNTIASIGVSNFELADMVALQNMWTIPPSIYQGNIWTLLFDSEMMGFLASHGIHFQAYNVMNGIFSRVDQAPNAFQLLKQVATDISISTQHEEEHEIYQVTPQMLVLRWLSQLETSVIPRTTKLEHLESNSPVSLSRIPPLNNLQLHKISLAAEALVRGQDLPSPQVSFHNQAPREMNVFWYNHHDGEEIWAASVPPGDSYHVESTYKGHKFVTYFKDDEHGDESNNNSHRQEFTVQVDFAEHERFHVTEL